MKLLTQLITLIFITMYSFNLAAETPEEKGYAIAKQVDLNDQGWKDTTASMKMILRNREGKESQRDIRLKILEVNGDGDKSLIMFDNPRDVKGTNFLSFSHITDPDDQWLYLPSLKRVKRISSSNKSGPFMGGQFAYEDLASYEVDKFKYKYLRDGKVDGIDVYIVDAYPQYEYSGYTRQVVWVDKQRYIPLKIEFYDRKNDLLKTLSFKHYKQYLNKYWRADEQAMENHQNGKSTILVWSDYRFTTGLSDDDFDRNSLKRAR